MTDYVDIEKVNGLYRESQTVAQAIVSLDLGGTVSNITISPPPAQPAAPGQQPTVPTGPMGPMMMYSSIGILGEVDPVLLKGIRELLVQREKDIAMELADLGVTASPPLAGAREYKR